MDEVESELEDIFTMLNDARYTHKDLEDEIKENFDKLNNLLHAQGEVHKDLENEIKENFDKLDNLLHAQRDVIIEVETNKDIIRSMSLRLDRANGSLKAIFVCSILMYSLLFYIVHLIDK